jgi:hypothetical protein
MTEYEMLAAAQGQVNILMTDVMNMFTVMASYLVVGYLAAHRISFAMALFVTALFVLFSLSSVMLQAGSTSTLLAVIGHITAEAAGGKAFAWWHGVGRPLPGVQVVTVYAVLLVMAAAVIGSVYFFFECRWRNMKAEVAAATKPQA